ncbi:pimeloyl-ACP methyl ester carboxylesterase [Paenibacillus mucilaginosus]|uniref:alpha/beta fold hydrolase n=1 Tax=Paenibacillus mucilaginosus TaxID=61624 RepID=UPI003D2360F7
MKRRSMAAVLSFLLTVSLPVPYAQGAGEALSAPAPTAAADSTTERPPVNESGIVFQGKVDIGGYGLYVTIRGERREGLPTVVFENGYGDSSGIWDAAAAELAKVTQVVSYDRANIGLSDAPSSTSYSALDAANRLNLLLKKTGVNGPLVLIGHSMGGLYIREYAYLYPTSVKGLIFVDASHEHMEDVLFPEYPVETRRSIVEDDLVTSGGREGHYYPDVDNTYRQIDQGRQTDFLRSVPITVLSGGNHGYPDTFIDGEARWAQLQRSLAALSNDSVHVTDRNSGHYLHTQNPSLVVASAVTMFGRIK